MTIFTPKGLLTLSTLCFAMITNHAYANNSVSIPQIKTELSTKTSQPVVRKSVFDPDNKDVEHYRLAVSLMKALPKTDKRNWYFMSGIHGYFDEKDQGSEAAWIYRKSLKPEEYGLHTQKGEDGKSLAYFKDENGNPTNIQAWDLCHKWGADNSLFLLWHRVYVYSLENIARELITQYTKQQSHFALPYWDYTDLKSEQKKKLPSQFNNPPNQTNSLYEELRSAQVQNSGIRKELLDIVPAFREKDMVAFSTELEGNVHGNVHVEIGNPNTNYLTMGQVKAAAQDPIFWLHHSNIDRLWSCWNKNGGQNSVFADSNKKFSFVQPDGSIKTYSVKEMEELVKSMTYEYDSYEDCSGIKIEDPLVSSTSTLNLSVKGPVNVKNKSVAVPVKTSLLKNTKLNKASIKYGTLKLTNINSHSDMSGLYDVYLKSPELNKEIFVNSISFFGFHASSGHHSSISRKFNATNAINTLLKDGAELDKLEVVIKPDSRLNPEKLATLSQEFQISSINLEITIDK